MLRRLPLSFGCLLLLAACAETPHAAVPHQPAIQVSKHGRYSVTYPVPLSQVATTTQKALRQLGTRYQVVTLRTPSEMVIRGLTTQHEVIQVTMIALHPRATSVSFHSGYWGNHSLSLRFLGILDRMMPMRGGPHQPQSRSHDRRSHHVLVQHQ
ncbi:DUF3568 family protein [Acidithiobacillus ferrianus]